MTISVLNFFSIGIGPSSSHTVGPMRAAVRFMNTLVQKEQFSATQRVTIELFGSLAHTGQGHGTDRAILCGLEGDLPEHVDPDRVYHRCEELDKNQILNLLQKKNIEFIYSRDFIYEFKTQLPLHSNGMRFSAFDANHQLLHQEVFYSVGGGFIATDQELSVTTSSQPTSESIPFPFNTAEELLKHCREQKLSIAQVVWQNELYWNEAEVIRQKLRAIGDVMRSCIDRGCQRSGILPGGLGVRRRAADLYQRLMQTGKPNLASDADSLNWLNLYAIAVNEENAVGGRVVTAPTNGGAGVVPAVLYYYMDFYPQADEQKKFDFLLTAGAIAMLCKKGASISGAEVGCQGEVGSASAMAAAGLTAVLGGTPSQVENAAEIAIEHHLGLTCDPVKGLVQIPCIERNAMGAVKAVNAARLALMGDGQHFVSLDKALATMRQTGHDMMSIYKETSLGGLAVHVNLPEC